MDGIIPSNPARVPRESPGESGIKKIRLSGKCAVMRVKTDGSLYSPLCSCLSITLPASCKRESRRPNWLAKLMWHLLGPFQAKHSNDGRRKRHIAGNPPGDLRVQTGRGS